MALHSTQATKAVSQSYDDVLELFEELENYVDRFKFRSSRRTTLSPASRTTAVNIFADILRILALAKHLLAGKKVLGSRRLGTDQHPFIGRRDTLIHSYTAHYFTSLVRESDMKGALARFRQLTSRESHAFIDEIRVFAEEAVDLARDNSAWTIYQPALAS
jgi:hypothetical protein